MDKRPRAGGDTEAGGGSFGADDTWLASSTVALPVAPDIFRAIAPTHDEEFKPTLSASLPVAVLVSTASLALPAFRLARVQPDPLAWKSPLPPAAAATTTNKSPAEMPLGRTTDLLAVNCNAVLATPPMIGGEPPPPPPARGAALPPIPSGVTMPPPSS